MLEFREATFAAPRPSEGYRTFLASDAGLLLADHATTTAYLLEKGRWRHFAGALFADPPQPWHVHVAYGDGALWAQANGGLWRTHPQGRFGCVIEAWSEPSPNQFAHRTAMAWEPVAQRLVVQGGLREATTWFADVKAKRWRKLAGAGPPSGVGRAITGKDGLYFLVGRELWRLAGDEWTCLHRTTRWAAGEKRTRGGALELMMHDGAFLAVGPVKDHLELSILDGKDWRAAAELPEAARQQAMSCEYPAAVGLDPVGQRLIGIAGQRDTPVHLFELPLASLALRPPPEWTPVVTTRKQPPPERRRPALVLEPSGEKAARPALFLPKGWRALAALPLGDRGAVVSYREDDPMQMRVDLLPDPPAPALEQDSRWVTAELVPFDDIDPAVRGEYDLDAAAGSTHSSKIGGYPWENHDEACGDCGAALEFLAQLSAQDHFPILGDGTLYVLGCPKCRTLTAHLDLC